DSGKLGDCREHKLRLQALRSVNSAETDRQNDAGDHQHNDVDQITKPTQSAHPLLRLDLIFRHPARVKLSDPGLNRKFCVAIPQRVSRGESATLKSTIENLISGFLPFILLTSSFFLKRPRSSTDRTEVS